MFIYPFLLYLTSRSHRSQLFLATAEGDQRVDLDRHDEVLRRACFGTVKRRGGASLRRAGGIGPTLRAHR